VALIELLRDAWLATRGRDPEGARRIALGWFEMSYPTFKRLALFAAAHVLLTRAEVPFRHFPKCSECTLASGLTELHSPLQNRLWRNGGSP
jgi:hypothetical protein